MLVRLVTSPHVRHPAVLQSDFRPNNSVMYGFAPVGLLSLIAVVRSELGFTPELFDLNRCIRDGSVPTTSDFYDVLARLIARDAPDVVGIMTECDSYHHVLQICEALRKVSDCKIVLGGPHASAVASATLSACPYIDAVVVGEAERSFPALLGSYERGGQERVAGVLRRVESGTILIGDTGPLVEDLDQLPVPAYDVYKPDVGEEIFLEVGRGCPFRCTFCSTAPFWQRRHRVKSPARIVSEIQTVVSMYGSRRFHFTHDLFTTDQKWVVAVCNELIKAGIPARWTCSARTDLVDADLLGRMVEAGCDAIYFGIESGSPRVLKAIGKDIPVQHSLNILALCRSLGIKANAGYIVGLPQDDEESVKETFDAYHSALRLGCKPTHLFGYCPFAASEMFPPLSELRFTGHFLDLPLGDTVDQANKKKIHNSPELFASYLRPKASNLWVVRPGFLDGIDEFSPLVESALLPALALAETTSGGMLQVYKDWLEWISEENKDRDPRPSRRWYGSPGDFCRFLNVALANAPDALAGADSLARVLGVGYELKKITGDIQPTSIAGYRSIVAPASCGEDLATPISLVGVLAIEILPFDVSAGLSWQTGTPHPSMLQEPTCYVWQESERGQVKLLATSRSLFPLIESLANGPRNPAQLLAQWSGDPDRAVHANISALFEQIQAATNAGLVVAHDM